jgi:hypothetical protein
MEEIMKKVQEEIESEKEFYLFHKKYLQKYNNELSKLIEMVFNIKLPFSWKRNTISLEVFCQENGLEKNSEMLYKQYMKKVQEERRKFKKIKKSEKKWN